jgi:hypothetical protein
MSKLGGTIHGKTQIAGIQNTLVGGEVALKRKILRKAFGSNIVNNQKSSAGPFRAAFYLGDPLSRKNKTCGGPNQINGTFVNRSNIGDSVGTDGCDNTNIPIESGNSKYVSNSSDYTRFKNLATTNTLYDYIETTKI